MPLGMVFNVIHGLRCKFHLQMAAECNLVSSEEHGERALPGTVCGARVGSSMLDGALVSCFVVTPGPQLPHLPCSPLWRQQQWLSATLSWSTSTITAPPRIRALWAPTTLLQLLTPASRRRAACYCASCRGTPLYALRSPSLLLNSSREELEHSNENTDN